MVIENTAKNDRPVGMHVRRRDDHVVLAIGEVGYGISSSTARDMVERLLRGTRRSSRLPSGSWPSSPRGRETRRS